MKYVMLRLEIRCRGSAKIISRQRQRLADVVSQSHRTRSTENIEVVARPIGDKRHITKIRDA